MSKNLMLYISLMLMLLSFYNNIFYKIIWLIIYSKFMLLVVFSKKLVVNNQQLVISSNQVIEGCWKLIVDCYIYFKFI